MTTAAAQTVVLRIVFFIFHLLFYGFQRSIGAF
jgi:hypothetical protein